MMYLPGDEDLTFYFDAANESEEYTFSFMTNNQTYSLINKTITKNNEEKLSVFQKESKEEYVVGISGTGDSDYTIKCSRTYENSDGEFTAREYIVGKNSDNDHEDVEVALTRDKESVVIRNNNDENMSFSTEFRSTEALDTVEYIPSSGGDVIIPGNQALSVTPSNWQTTELQADITQAIVIDQESTPGFELLFVVTALLVAVILKKKKD